ncbi:MAG: hypothetical protein LBQ39_08750 [Tannerellaceae bacterium]|jgi:hypothetical protein|nr:hypothetical protein [Tannerellaceae bacterium]
MKKILGFIGMVIIAFIAISANVQIVLAEKVLNVDAAMHTQNIFESWNL